VAFDPEDPNVSKEALQESYSTDIFLSIPPDVTRNLVIEAFKAACKGRFSPVAFSFGASNQGNCHVDIDASLTIKDSKSIIVRELRLTDRNTRILPGLTRIFTVEDSQGFESGVYNCALTVKVGKSKVLYSTCTLKI
jgi:hypothetical protein